MPCCKFNTWKYDREYNFNKGDTIQDYTLSQAVNDAKEKLMAGEWPAGCQRCQRDEEAGVPSKRQLDYTQWQEHYEAYQPEDGFITVDIPFGNACNLKCIMCSSYASSKWRKEYIDIYGIDYPANYSMNKPFAEWMLENLPNIIHMDIPGGEPFITDVPQQLKVLQNYIQSGQSKKITLHYTTNAQQLPPEEFWDAWEHYDHVDLQLSIDGIGPRYEYIRYPGRWDKTERVAQEYLNRTSKMSNASLSLSYTVSAFNILYIDEMFDWKRSIGFPHEPYLGPVAYPRWFSPLVWQEAKRDLIRDRLMSSPYPEVQQCTGLLATEDDADLYKQFIEYRDKHDSYRGLNFSEVFPELT